MSQGQAIISIDYEKMAAVSNQFSEQAKLVKAEFNKLTQQIDTLKNNNWKADAATSYYNDMDQDCCPGIQRLLGALDLASDTCKQIASELSKAEDDACTCLPTNI